jgi:hypothetical protein
VSICIRVKKVTPTVGNGQQGLPVVLLGSNEEVQFIVINHVHQYQSKSAVCPCVKYQQVSLTCSMLAFRLN